MSEAVQEPVQRRDGAGQAPLVTKQVVRGPDERAVQVTERHVVWDRPVVHPPTIDEPAFDVGALGPIPTEWTHDLVHCRLIAVDRMARRLSPVKVPSDYRSFLGVFQPQEASVRRAPLTPEEVVRFDWTWTRISRWPERDRAIIMGIMAGHSVRDVEKVLARGAAKGRFDALKRSGISKRYKAIRTEMAREWIGLREVIDLDTREAWLSTSKKSA
ncbi:hypothetical protein [Reyranella sp.]|uniref:hypothetical protein n=1 Tax=Reyranella sp. TaxID=1929291 RepID=UPI003C79AEA9